MSQRQAVTKVIATRYQRADKGAILDELCATRAGMATTAVGRWGGRWCPGSRGRAGSRLPMYGENVVVALRFCWAVLAAPTGKWLAPVMDESVATLWRFGELDVSDEVAGALTWMSAATTDRRLALDRAAMRLRGRSHTKPGSLLKDPDPDLGAVG